MLMRVASLLFALLALGGVLLTILIAAFVTTPLEPGAVGSGEWGWVVITGAASLMFAVTAVSLWRQARG
jgi:hypothetical protein